MSRGITGATPQNNALIITMYSANALTWALADLCDLDTGANRTVKKPVNDAVLFGKVVAIEGPATSTSATSTILSVLVYGFTGVDRIDTDASVALGVSIHHNGTANYVETEGDATGRNLVIASAINADSTYTLDVLY